MAQNTKVNEDIFKCLDIYYGNPYPYMDFEVTYQRTNELLGSILPAYDFKDKKVLSVLSSGDHVFSAYYLGAKEVDSFDANRFTYYFYFLKKWCIIYHQQTGLPVRNNDLKRVLDFSRADEYDAKYFWYNVLQRTRSSIARSQLFHPLAHDHSLPYEKDVKTLSKIIENKGPNFTNLNIFRPLPKQHGTYDIVLLSNIMEYVKDYDRPHMETQLRDNLISLLNPNGIVVNTNISYVQEEPDELYEDAFEFAHGPIGKTHYKEHEHPLSYTYKLRK